MYVGLDVWVADAEETNSILDKVYEKVKVRSVVSGSPSVVKDMDGEAERDAT